ncbi:MAG: YlxM family DNA-binding protein [Bacillota bacterium]
MERNVELGILLDRYGCILTPRQRKLMGLHVNEDLSLAEIAEREGISRQGVHDAIRRAQAQLDMMEQELKLLERTRKVSLLAQELRAMIAGAELSGALKDALLNRIGEMEQSMEEPHGV